MATAGRATLFSGLTVAIGLALLLLMPVPFMRSMGAGAVLIPLVSIAASATLLPALLSLMGTRINRFRVVPRSVLERRASGAPGAWSRLAHSIMRHPVMYFVVSLGVLLALAAPALGLHLTGGDNRGSPHGTEATDGLYVLEATVGPGALAPHQIVVDTGTPGGAESARHCRGRAPSGRPAACRPAHRGLDGPGAGDRPASTRAAGGAAGPDPASAADTRRRAHGRGHRRGAGARAHDPRSLHPRGGLPPIR